MMRNILQAICLSMLCVSQFMHGWLHAETAAEAYARRILPLVRSSSASSCTQCHLRGVDLKDFLSEDPAETFAQLRARGWIDIAAPEKSKLLAFVARQDAGHDPLIDKVRENELSALTQWITLAVKDPASLAAVGPPARDLELPLDFIRHARSDRILAQFADTIWSQLGRCANCHSPDRNAKQVKEHGKGMSWIVPGDPTATLKLLVERKIIDIDRPEESPLRTKPLVIVEHGGGPKFPLQSETATRWTDFLIDYARTARKDGYQTHDALPGLPSRRSWLSEHQIRITKIPGSFSGQLLVVTLHRKKSDGSIDQQPVAHADSTVNEKQLVWQQSLTIYRMITEAPVDVGAAGSNVPRPALSTPTANGKINGGPSSRGTSGLLGSFDWTKPLKFEEVVLRGEYVVQVWARDLQAPALNSPSDVPRKVIARFNVSAPWPAGYQPPLILEWPNP